MDEVWVPGNINLLKLLAYSPLPNVGIYLLLLIIGILYHQRVAMSSWNSTKKFRLFTLPPNIACAQYMYHHQQSKSMTFLTEESTAHDTMPEVYLD